VFSGGSPVIDSGATERGRRKYPRKFLKEKKRGAACASSLKRGRRCSTGEKVLCSRKTMETDRGHGKRRKRAASGGGGTHEIRSEACLAVTAPEVD